MRIKKEPKEPRRTIRRQAKTKNKRSYKKRKRKDQSLNPKTIS